MTAQWTPYPCDRCSDPNTAWFTECQTCGPVLLCKSCADQHHIDTTGKGTSVPEPHGRVRRVRAGRRK